jgi:hypothetical protein
MKICCNKYKEMVINSVIYRTKVQFNVRKGLVITKVILRTFYESPKVVIHC